ncbi:MAG TPA: hypothetical protein VGX71_15260 [Pseudaminobacter sp.]|nr:hypothetical protein [Pseudaminobacter sp.]
MPYVQHTQCVKPDDHVGLAPGLIVTAIAAVALLLVGVGWGVIGVAATTAVIVYCRWWLYDRLVCLGGDRCAVGLLVETHPPSEKSGFDAFDTDYSIDLLLAPDTPQDCVIADKKNQADPCLVRYFGGFQKDLIMRQLDANKFKDYTGEFSDAPFLANVNATPKLVTVPVLHAEFEGGGVKVLHDAAVAALAVSVVGAVFCAIPIIGWIACVIAAVIAAAILGIAAIIALNDTGSPTDVNSELDELHSYRDVLVVRGTWVYDTAHEGWNEIHPIKHCQRIENSGGGLTGCPADIEVRAREWCGAVSEAQSELTVESQSRPENQWEIHPAIDGCRPAGGIPEPGPIVH